MKRTIYIFSCFMFLTSQAWAQSGETEYRYDDATQLWRNTDMAAGLSIDSARNRGVAYFDACHTEGDYARVQEGSMQNRVQFFTERYQAIGKYLYGMGRFMFDMDRTKGRAWSDVQQTYNANPFISGSSIAGKYDNQSFDFTAAVGTVDFSGWRLGTRLDYKVGDLSRLRDPRSRSQLLDYRLTPSATYSVGAHTLGLSAAYHRRKEKIPSLTTVQDDPNLMYYLMSGMEVAEGTVGGYKGFSREWVNHEFGASLAYGYRKAGFASLTNVGIRHGEEYVYETYKREPGRYYTYKYDLQTQNRMQKGNMLHQLDVKADYMQGYADEYRQQLIVDKDATTGYTSYSYETLIKFRKRWQVRQMNLNLHYRLSFTDRQAVTGYVGIKETLATTHDKHLLPTSRLEYSAWDTSIEGGKALLRDNRLWVDAQAGYHHAPKADLSLADATTDYARGVLLPDINYLSADYWQGRLAVTYQFPLTIKGTRSLWFVRAYSQYLRATGGLDRHAVGLSIGLFN